jgi:uncharacterized protein (UPF0276 family)
VTEISFSANNLGDFPLYDAVRAERGMSAPLPFVEVLWDNYCHLEPEELADLLAPLSGRVSFHVMMSKWLQRAPGELAGFLRQLGRHVRVVRPVRVSDHLARFRIGNLNTQLPLEHGYRGIDRACERVRRYQDAIDQPLLVENYASTDASGRHQLEFMGELMSRTGCGVLFDVSNAVVADLNGITPVADWIAVLAGLPVDAHVGGYRLGKAGDLYHDTHDQPISHETASALRALLATADVRSICYERDYNKDVASLSGDLAIIQDAVAEQVGPAPLALLEAAR